MFICQFNLLIYHLFVSFADEELVWLGCGPLSNVESTSSVPEMTSVRDCRAICSATAYNVAAIRNKTDCACADISAIDDMKKENETCNQNSDWALYSASGLGDHDADYEITVTVELLGEKPYVKPFEEVLIHISTNFVVNVPFLVDFGDGASLITDVYTVSYHWLVEGTYQITVSTAIGIASVTGSVDFTIENVDEGYAGDYVMLNVHHAEQSRVANIDFVNVDYATAVCGVKYGESEVTDIQLTDLAEYVENAHLTNVYSDIGRYHMHVDCLNPYGSIQNDTYFTSRKLETTYHFHDKDTEFVTPVDGDTEFFTRVEVSHHDSNVSPILHSENSSFLAVDPNSIRIYENVLTYSFEDVDIDKRIVNVQNNIEKPVIFSPEIDGAWNLTTNITVRVPAGNNMFLNVSFSAGEDQLFYIHNLPFPSEIMFEIMFPVLGYYPVHANISNDISFNTADMLVSVEVPLRTISLNVTNIVDKRNPVVLLIDLNEDTQGPMKVNFEIDQGNGYVDTYYHYNDKYFFPTYRHEYIYSGWGRFDICVRAFNRISSVIDCIEVQVGEEISYVDILTPTAGRFAPNETVNSVIRSPEGSDKTYIVDFGDGETFVFTDTYLEETEDFLDTTTTSLPTTLTTTQTFSDNSSTTVTAVTESATGVLSANGTTPAPTFTTVIAELTTTSALPLLDRRRREANGTVIEAVTMDAANVTTPSGISDTLGGNTDLVDIADSGSNNYTGLNETDKNLTETTTVETTSTTVAVPTTTTELPTTMAPIPDDAVNPYTTSLSSARRRRDGAIIVTHRYQDVGEYIITVQTANHFNWKRNQLCPKIVVAEENTNATCSLSELTVNSKLSSTKRSPLSFFRSEQINLTATAVLHGCGNSAPTYSWRTEVFVNENGKEVRRPYQDSEVCVLETTEKIFKYPRSSLPFGKYVATLVVSPSGHPLKVATKDFYMTVKPSAPHAVIEGEEHQWFLSYGSTILKFERSIDPDFHTHDGIEYDLVCMTEGDLKAAKLETRQSIIEASTLVVDGITFKYTSKNPVRLYEYTSCFNQDSGANMTRDVRFPNAQLIMPSDYFLTTVNSFAMFLYVTKNDMTTMAYRTFDIRSSNETDLLAQLDDLLASKDTAGVMRAVTALSATLITTSVSAVLC